MKFAMPQLLLLMACTLMLLAVFLVWAARKRQRLAAAFIQRRLADQLTLNAPVRRAQVRLALQLLAAACAFLALGRPQWGYSWEQVRQRGLDILVAIDTSRSMLAQDVTPNRLARAKLAALDLLKLAKTDRLGLIAFAGSAFLQCPLTLDDQAFRESVNTLSTSIIPQGGSSLSQAIQTAIEAAKKDPDNHRALVLFSDGEDHEEGALEAAKMAAKIGLKIFTVGVGTPNGELLRTATDTGQTDWIRDDQGNAVKSRLNETLLQQIATATEGGFYVPLRGAQSVETLFQKGLAPMPKSEIQSRMIQRHHERFQWPLALGILCLLAELLVRDAPPRPAVRVPLRAAPSRTVPSLLLSLLVSAGVVDLNPLQAASGAQLYREGRFAESYQSYRDAMASKPTDLRLHYNAGAAAYRAKRFQDATSEFESASRSSDLSLQQQAHYNLGNALYRQGESEPEPQAKSGQWELALRAFDNAIRLNTNDADAQFNRGIVQKRLEELKQQQQQQQQQSQDNQAKDPKDQSSKQDSKSNPNEKKDQDRSGEQSSNSNEKKQDSEQDRGQKDREGERQQDPANSQPQSDQPQKPEKSPNDRQEQKSNPNQQAQSSGAKNQPDQAENGESPGSPATAAQIMTPAQALQLIETQRGEEKAMIFTNAMPRRGMPRIFKDW